MYRILSEAHSKSFKIVKVKILEYHAQERNDSTESYKSRQLHVKEIHSCEHKCAAPSSQSKINCQSRLLILLLRKSRTSERGGRGVEMPGMSTERCVYPFW